MALGIAVVLLVGHVWVLAELLDDAEYVGADSE